MALNPYFQGHNVGHASEHMLYENMIVESIQMTGQEYYYIPRTISGKFDQIFGEDVLSSFNSYAKIEMYLENVTGYGGESEMMAKFGLEIRDNATFIVSRKRFTEEVAPIIPADRNPNVKWRPCEGDLIYVPFSQSLFEIRFVEDEYPGFYQLRKKFVWALRTELIQLNNEKFNTGSSEIDELFGKNLDRLNTTIIMEDGSSIMTEDGGRALLEEYSSDKQYDDIIGFGDNDHVKKEFVQIMDFTEDNPFGEYN